MCGSAARSGGQRMGNVSAHRTRAWTNCSDEVAEGVGALRLVTLRQGDAGIYARWSVGRKWLRNCG